jgi:predicted permease
MAESLLVAFAGAVLGGWIAQSLSRSLVSLLGTDNSSLFFDLRMDWKMLGFTAGLALITCVLFGLMPAFRATKTTPASVLRAGGRGMTDGSARFTLRRALVVGQLAMSLVLLVGALLFLRTFRNLAHVDTGLDTTGVFEADFDLRRTSLPPDRMLPFQIDFLDRVKRAPGVANAASIAVTPISGGGWNETLIIDGKPQETYPNINRVSPEYFDVLRIPLQAGRIFDARDTRSSQPVAVVTSAFVKRYMNDSSPLGRTFRFEQAPGDTPLTYEIIGVAADAKYLDLREKIGPIVYLPLSQDGDPSRNISILVRSSRAGAAGASAGGSSGLTAAMIAAARDADPSILVTVSSLSEQIQGSLLTERLMAMLSGFFGLLAGLLAAIGLYGVMSYTVAQRRQEIGIRMALGADRRRVLWMIGREAGLLVVIGVAAGAIAAAFAVKYADTLLFGLKPRDPFTFAAAVAVLAAVAVIATLVPALRASRLHPTTALRDS